jgi:lysosomal Pro-X carboxypeptidase
MFESAEWDYSKYIEDCYENFQVVPRPEWPVVYYGGKNIRAHSNIVFSNGGSCVTNVY